MSRDGCFEGAFYGAGVVFGLIVYEFRFMRAKVWLEGCVLIDLYRGGIVLLV